jgi:hypothetical protein
MINGSGAYGAVREESPRVDGQRNPGPGVEAISSANNRAA